MKNNLPQVSFYHFTKTTFDKALFSIVQKALSHQFRIFILTENAARTDEIDKSLWSLGRISFIPHATIRDQELPRQPILIGENLENKNNSNIIISVDNRKDFDVNSFTRIINLVDGNNIEKLELARETWKYYKNLGCEMQYWFQNTESGWQKK